jgi:predicted protein tyrosine phosphatase
MTDGSDWMKGLSASPASSEGTLVITSAWTAREIAPKLNPDFIISLMDPGDKFSLPTGPGLRRHLHLEMHDIDNQGAAVPSPYVGPTAEHVEQIFDAARTWNRSAVVLIHCVAGISRSAAAGLVFLAARNPGREHEIALSLRREGPWLNPNPSVVGLGDDLLGLQGALRRALDAMGEASVRGASAVLSQYRR